jgi:hypothetical protein
VPTEKDKVVEFQKAFSEFVTQHLDDGGALQDFVFFYLSKERGGGVIQSFGNAMTGISYVLHVCSSVLRKDNFDMKIFVMEGSKLTGIYDPDEGEDHDQKPN